MSVQCCCYCCCCRCYESGNCHTPLLTHASNLLPRSHLLHHPHLVAVVRCCCCCCNRSVRNASQLCSTCSVQFVVCTHLLHIVEVRLGLCHLPVQLFALLVLRFGHIGQRGYGIFAFGQTLTKCIQFTLHQ